MSQIIVKRTVDNSDKPDDSAVHDDIQDLSVCIACHKLVPKEKLNHVDICEDCLDKINKGTYVPLDLDN